MTRFDVLQLPATIMQSFGRRVVDMEQRLQALLVLQRSILVDILHLGILDRLQLSLPVELVEPVQQIGGRTLEHVQIGQVMAVSAQMPQIDHERVQAQFLGRHVHRFQLACLQDR